jgi:hypothetical protein
MKSYADQGISLQKKIRRKTHEVLLTAECLNFLNVPYDVVRSFPMPGRAFRLGINFEL